MGTIRIVMAGAMAAAAVTVGTAPAWASERDSGWIAYQPATDYAARLKALKDQGWREAFALGQQIAGLPPDEGWAIIRDAWGTLEPVHARQQILKAWYLRAPDGKTPMGLTERGHAHLKDVLDLGMKDASPEVREWAADFLKKSAAEPGKAAEPPKKSETPKATGPAGPTGPIMGDAEIDAADLRAGGDDLKRYILIGPRKGAAEPADGWKILLVLPGGDGSAEFHPFVRNVAKQALPDGYLVAQLVAPVWRDSEERVVWPTKGLPDDKMKFGAEDFIKAVVEDAATKRKIDRRHVYALGWSSGGPPVYASSVTPGTPLTGAFVAMSVFHPDAMPPLMGAKGRPYYLLQSPQDRVTRPQFADAAKGRLSEAGAKVHLQTYEGGHGWHGDVFGNIRKGVEWLEGQAAK